MEFSGGRLNFEAHKAALLNLDVDPEENWDELEEYERMAWEAAASTVRNALLTEIQQGKVPVTYAASAASNVSVQKIPEAGPGG